MSSVTVLTMLFALGTVWGGFTAVLVTALRKERRKRQDDA
jgi:cbb3-type cytochrome oxidase subunit 3